MLVALFAGKRYTGTWSVISEQFWSFNLQLHQIFDYIFQPFKRFQFFEFQIIIFHSNILCKNIPTKRSLVLILSTQSIKIQSIQDILSLARILFMLSTQLPKLFNLVQYRKIIWSYFLYFGARVLLGNLLAINQKLEVVLMVIIITKLCIVIDIVILHHFNKIVVVDSLLFWFFGGGKRLRKFFLYN